MFKFHVERSLAHGGPRMAILRGSPHQSRGFIQPFVVKTFEPGIVVPDAELWAIDDGWHGDDIMQFLQAASDAAWEQGMRPVQARDATSELAAVRYHLEDMRRLALLGSEASK